MKRYKLQRYTTFIAWLSGMQLVIASPKPRRTIMPLYELSRGLRIFFSNKQITSGQLEDLLQTLDALRASRCNGRLACEKDILNILNDMCSDWVFVDNALDIDGKLMPDFVPPSEAELAEKLRMFELLANHAKQLLSMKPIKLVDYNRLIEEAYDLLELLTWRPELENLFGECLTLSLNQLSEGDPPFAHTAIEFIDRFHYRFTKDQSIPKKIIKQLEELSERTKNGSTAFAINNLFVDLGIICKFTAMDTMDDFRDSGDDW